MKKFNIILLWSLLVLQLVYAVVEFWEGSIAFGLNCIWFAAITHILIEAYERIEEKDKIIDSLPTPCQTKLKFITEIEEELAKGKCRYDWYMDKDGYYVCLCSNDDYWIPIKYFPNEDDPAFAQLCAEELVEKLNEK